MAKVAVLIADGFEEIEAVTIIDVLRRGGVTVTVAALEGEQVLGSHGIRLGVDTTVAERLLSPAGIRPPASVRTSVKVIVTSESQLSVAVGVAGAGTASHSTVISAGTPASTGAVTS